jgi:apolipoprotein N-acyltransferase
MYALLSGAIAVLSLVAATSFLRSYVRTRDRFFALFAAAFALLGLTQLWLGITNTPELNRPLAYIPRLIVFLLILFAIFDKNRTQVKQKEMGVVADFPPEARRRAAR